MNLIINEHSLSGFIDVDDFIKKTIKFTIPTLTIIDNVIFLNLYNIVILKKSNLYENIVFDNVSFRKLLNQKKSARGLKREVFYQLKKKLYKLQNQPPFWDKKPKHNCNDNYKTKLINDTCNYSIAEACERDKKVVSFYSNEFTKNTIKVTKNNSEIIEICNIFSIDSFWKCIVGEHLFNIENYPLNWEKSNKRNPTANLFPAAEYISKLLDIDKYYKERSRLKQGVRISKDKFYAKIVATLNYWQYNSEISNKNSGSKHRRMIFSAGSGHKIRYISLDTENCRFELFDNKGIHLGEYDFNGNQTKKSNSNRKINV